MKEESTEKILKLLSRETISRLNRKQTKNGILKELLTLRAFKEIYKDPETVLKKIFEVRSKKTEDRCPRCGCNIDLQHFRPSVKMKYACKRCNFAISPLVGTPLERTHMKLNLILELIFRMVQSKHGLTASEVSRDYGMSYDSAAATLTRIRNWMGLYINQARFGKESYIEIDEVFPKKPTGFGRGFKWSRGMGSERISKVITMVERGQGLAKGYVVDEVNRESVDRLVNQHLSQTNKIRTDEKKVYHYLGDEGWDHDSCNHHKKEWVNDDAHTNTCESLHSFLQGNIRTVYRGVKHTQRYVDETTFVFSHRSKGPYDAIDNLFDVLPPFFANKQLN